MMSHRALSAAAAPTEREGYPKSRETRARILAAALAEASETGLHKTSVARIAARAGVALGSLNYHFGSRDELLRELMTEQMSNLMLRLHAADADEGADFFERQRAGLQIKLHDPELYRQGVADWVARMAARIRAGIDEGCVRPMDESEIGYQAHFLVGARHFIEQLREVGDGPADDAVVDAYLGLVRDGLRRPAEARRARKPKPKTKKTPKRKRT
jgi:AcrR family transcriptional regulator